MRIKSIIYTLLLLPLLAVASCSSSNNSPNQLSGKSVKSPNGNIELTFALTDNGRPTYEMSYKGKAVVLPSHLGLILAKDKHASRGDAETDLMEHFTIKSQETSTFDETWEPVWGETKTIRNHYNELAVTLEQDTARTIVIRFCVYDDGIGFRYEFPQQKDLNYFLIQEEMTEFAMAGNHTAWWLPGDYDTQEQETQQTKLSEIRGRMKEAVNWGRRVPTDCISISMRLPVPTMPRCTSNWWMERPRRSPRSWVVAAMPIHLTPRALPTPCRNPIRLSVI